MAILKDVDKQMQLIRRATVEIISETELRRKIEQSIKKNKPLIIKAGFDPSAPDLHLGHTVLLRKLRHFQELGHKVVFLIGDYTAIIGDPSGQSATRPTLTKKEVIQNAKTYQKQVSKILDLKKLKIVFNSTWLSKMDSYQIAELLSKYTVARVLERDDFSKRYKEGKDISLLEFLYPLLQAYDSVVLDADIELGGSDQKFNLLMGRTIQERYSKEPQTIITMPLLEGTDGVRKMSKSYSNYIAIDDPAGEMYGKIMSISDEMMKKYYKLLTDIDLSSLEDMHPMEAKKKLAREIVAQYHGEKEAKEAQIDFEKKFQKKDLSGIELIKIPKDPKDENYAYLLQDLLRFKLKATESNSEFRRLVTQGSIRVNGQKITDLQFRLQPNKVYQVKVGKTRFFKIIIK
ncbi:MAG: tyrosine--tRNA ligase [Omnitrophica bacterium]|nr:tyrosine--tRNA ligase [Candidatus Omnitrophota bacterium]